MQIDSINGLPEIKSLVQGKKKNNEIEFLKVLNSHVSDIKQSKTFMNPLKENVVEIQNQPSKYVSLGKISFQHPTVSHLLVNHSVYSNDCWEIIHSKKNANKPYTKITEGTEIFLNAETQELAWGDDEDWSNKTGIATGSNSIVHAVDTIKNTVTDNFSEEFVDTVKTNIGMKYDDVNCYELLINALRKMGYRYGGYGGIKETLMNMAVSNGEPINTYLSGEGLISASGTEQYIRSVDNIHDYDHSTHEIYNEILPIIQKGQILSFSTPSRGHTGIISSKDGKWTYVNSGILDHSLDKYGERKGVGEETLVEEIKNWVKIAARRKEPLVVTLGRLDEQKLEKYKPVLWDT